MSKEIRVGILGCGKIARVSHIPRMKEIRGARVTALCDTDERRMEAVRAEHGLDAAMFTSPDALFNADLDAVCICTPNSLHARQALAAFRAGLHVLCEKPIAGTLADASRMIAAAKKAGKVLHINQSLRYHPPHVAIAGLLAKGTIGDLIHARCLRGGAGTPAERWSPGAKWFVSKAHQGGIILDIAIHMADMLRWHLGEVDEIAAAVDTRTPGIDVPDNVSAVFKCRSGATAILELSWTLPVGAGILEIYGTQGVIRMDGGAAGLQITRLTPRGPVTRPVKVPRRVPNSFQCFIAAVRGRAPSPTPGELGRDALALCDAIIRSGQSRRFVKVKHFA